MSVHLLFLFIRVKPVSYTHLAREKATGVNGAPVSPHLLAVFTACIEVGYLVSAKDIMHIPVSYTHLIVAVSII